MFSFGKKTGNSYGQCTDLKLVIHKFSKDSHKSMEKCKHNNHAYNLKDELEPHQKFCQDVSKIFHEQAYLHHAHLEPLDEAAARKKQKCQCLLSIPSLYSKLIPQNPWEISDSAPIF